jgi:predicted nucleotidyltransferase
VGSGLKILRAHRAEVLACLARHRAARPRVFGSVLREDERADSDVDLLVALPRDMSSFEVAQLGIELEALLGRRVDLVVEDELHPRLRERILAEARPL